VGKSIHSFAGGRLTILELGSASVGVSGIFLKPQVAKCLLFSATESLTSIVELNACHKNLHTVFWPVLCVYWWWGQSEWGPLERAQIFS